MGIIWYLLLSNGKSIGSVPALYLYPALYFYHSIQRRLVLYICTILFMEMVAEARPGFSLHVD